MTKRQAIVVMTGIGALFLILMTTGAFAQATFPTRTKGYRVSMVRAFDECTTPTLTVLAPSRPAAACAATNTLTDSVLGMRRAKVAVRPNGKLYLTGAGFAVGDALRVRLGLRVTQQHVDTNLGSDQSVTFSDVTVDCPAAPDAFLVRVNGSVHESFDLGFCLAPTFALPRGNIEVLQASVVNVDNGKPVAVPGVLMKPHGTTFAAPFPIRSNSYIGWMSRAMDECSPTTLTVSAPTGLPPGGCPQTNTITDSAMSMNYALLLLHDGGKVLVKGQGFPSSVPEVLQLTVRVTQQDVNTNMGLQTVTFPDLTIQCPPQSTQPVGTLYDTTSIEACLGASMSGLALGNLEIVDAALINPATSKVFAKPGVFRK